MIPILLSFNTNGTFADGQRSLVGHGPQGHKKSDTTEVTKQTQQFQVTSQKMLSGLNSLGKSSQTSKAFFVRSFPRGSHSKESACNAGDPGMIPGSGRSMEYIYLPGEFHRQRSLAGYSPWGAKDLDTSE